MPVTGVLVRVAGVLVALLTGVIGGGRLVMGHIQTPLSPLTLLDDPACNGPCWESIEVGVTNGTAVMDALSARGYSFEIFPLLKLDGYDIHYRGDDNYGTVKLERGVVEAISVPAQGCVGHLLMRYGVPPSVELVNGSYGRLFTVSGVGMFSQGAVLTYPAEGLVVFVPIYDVGAAGHYQMTLVEPGLLTGAWARDGWGTVVRYLRARCPDADPEG